MAAPGLQKAKRTANSSYYYAAYSGVSNKRGGTVINFLKRKIIQKLLYLSVMFENLGSFSFKI